MSIPPYQTVMLPLLKLAEERGVVTITDAITEMSAHFGLTDDEKAETIDSGKTKIRSRVEWAATYLVHAGAMSRPKRGSVSVTDRGRQIMSANPAKIDFALLSQFEEFRQFLGAAKQTTAADQAPLGAQPAPTVSPEELLDQGYRALRGETESTLLDRLRGASPEFFEQTVVDLLVAMGFGGSHRDAARRIGGTGDGGIDGVIDEDPLGLDALYVQAKRWKADRSVGIHEMQAFAGSLLGKKASKGAFITTSSFTQQAVKYLDSVNQRVVLIDGQAVARLMFEHGVGVRTRHSYDVKAVDESYFEET
jgi:restriction system protein